MHFVWITVWTKLSVKNICLVSHQSNNTKWETDLTFLWNFKIWNSSFEKPLPFSNISRFLPLLFFLLTPSFGVAAIILTQNFSKTILTFWWNLQVPFMVKNKITSHLPKMLVRGSYSYKNNNIVHGDVFNRCILVQYCLYQF